MGIDEGTEAALRYRAKAVLRQRARALRNTIPADALAMRSQRIVDALLALPPVSAAGSIALFWPIEGRNEVDLRRLDVALRQRGVRVAYPSIDESRVMTFRWVADTEKLEERGLGFREPSPDSEEVDRIDAIVVPGLQFDPRGHRLGYGAGFYDRALPRFAPPARAIGVAFDFQLVPEVPVTDGDVPVDTIVTDTKVIEAAGG